MVLLRGSTGYVTTVLVLGCFTDNPRTYMHLKTGHRRTSTLMSPPGSGPFGGLQRKRGASPPTQPNPRYQSECYALAGDTDTGSIDSNRRPVPHRGPPMPFGTGLRSKALALKK